MDKVNGRLTGRWLALTLDATDAQARALFRQRFGYEAAEVHRGKVIVYAGPVKEERWMTTETGDTESTYSAPSATLALS